MRNFFLFLISIWGFIPTIAQPLFLNNPVDVANNTLYGGIRPRIALYQDSIPFVVFGKGGSSPAVYFAKMSGGAFQAPIKLNPNQVNPLVSGINGPEIKISGDTVGVLFTTTNSVWLIQSFDGGTTFVDTTEVFSDPGNYTEFADFSYLPGGNPSVAILHLNNTSSISSILSTSSTNGGISFSAPVTASSTNPGQPCECCPISTVSRGNKIIIGYRNNISNTRDFYLTESLDGGISFTSGIRIDTTNWQIAACPSQGIDLMLDGDSIFATYLTRNGGYSRVHAATAGFSNFNAGQQFPLNPVTTYNEYYSAISGKNDTIAIVWHDLQNGGQDVFYSIWHNGIAPTTPTSYMLHNQTQGTQKNPDIAYGNGKFHFVWEDNYTGAVQYRSGRYSPLSIQEKDQIKLNCFPNPVSRDEILKISSNMLINRVLISTLQGKTVKEIEGRNLNEMVLSVSGFSPGPYSIQILGSKGELKTVLLLIQ